MRIALVEAGLPGEGWSWSTWYGEDGRFAVPSVGLVSLASLSRESDEVVIHDEKVSGSADGLRADLVGISYKTMNAPRAYALADAFRSRGTRVVLGGLHASLCPEEAAAHADGVAVGEGEPVWPRILEDAGQGKLQGLYRCPSPPPPIDDLPPQRVDLLAHDRYLYHAVQSARGCSLDCEFCPTRAMFGGLFRLRSADAVAREVERLLAIEEKPLLFTDDVFGAGDADFIAALTGRLRSLPVQYAVICDLKMLSPQVVQALATSGCRVMCLNMPGSCLPQEAAAVQAIQGAGIDIWGYFMFGFEFQKPDVFERVVDFVRECRLKYVSLTMLAPYPGTPMGERLAAEGRILSRDWSLYDQSHVVFRPAGMTPGELEAGFARVREAIGERCPIARTVGAFAGPRGGPGEARAPAFLDRTEALVGAEALGLLSRACVAIAGLGGVGGAVLSTLARMGVGRFRLGDPGTFDEPDMNRQWAATRRTLGRNKAEVYAQFLASVNPQARAELFTDGVTEDNVGDFLEGAGLLVDALDLKVAPPLRLKLAAAARERGIHDIVSPIIAFGTAVAVAAPDGMPMDPFMALIARARGEGKLPVKLAEIFTPAHLGIMQAQMGTGRVPSIAVAPALVASIVATEAAMILAGEALPGWRRPVCLPEVIVADLVRMSHRVVRIEEFA